MESKRARLIGPILCGGAYVIWMVVYGGIDDVFIFGADEGYELMKALLVSRGYDLYSEIWNDQPPLYTGLVALVFRGFGESVGVARAVAVCFSGTLVASVYALVCHRSGHIGAVVAVLVLLAWNPFLHLGVSVMLEPAMLAVCCLSAVALTRWQARGSCASLAVSGLLLGFALQIKLTAALFIPGMGMTLVLRAWRVGSYSGDSADGMPLPRDGLKNFLKAAGIWSGGGLVGVGLVKVIYSGETVWMLLASHFSTETRARLSIERYHGFDISVLLQHWDFLIPALIGYLFIVRGRDWRDAFPVIFLITVFGTHSVHRPYWSYYTLHFAVPVAWLCGRAMARMVDGLREDQRNPGGDSRTKVRATRVIMFSIVASLIFGNMPKRFRSGWNQVRSAQRIADNSVVTFLRTHAGGIRWIFSEDLSVAFHAGLAVPPPLAIIPAKRIWSEQIADEEVLREVRNFRPEVIYLTRNRWNSALSAYLAEGYRVQRVGGRDLHLRNDFLASER